MNRKLLGMAAAVLVGIGLAPLSYAQDSLSWNLTAGARYDDNIGLAPEASSERNATTYSVGGGVSWTPVQTAQDTTSLGVSLFYDAVDDLDDLSNYGARLNASHTHQFNEDFTAPWVRLALAGTWRQYEDSEPRDGYSGEAELAFGKRFNPTWEASIGVRYQMREGTDDNPEGTVFGTNSDEVFDQDREGAFVRVDISPAPKTALFIEYSYFTGDVASTADLLEFGQALQFDRVRDFAFEEGASYFAYKIDADQHVYSVGLTQDLTTRLRLDIGASLMDADAEGGNEYENSVVTLGLSLAL